MLVVGDCFAAKPSAQHTTTATCGFELMETLEHKQRHKRRPVALSWWKLWNTNNGIKRNFEAWLHGRQDCPELTTMDRKDFQTGLG